MNAPAYSSVPTKVLSIDHTFFDFFSIFSFIVNNCNCRSVFRKGVKINIFLLFTIIYSKININVVKTILPQFSAIICWCTVEKTQISLGKSLGNCQVLWRISKTGCDTSFLQIVIFFRTLFILCNCI